MPVCLNTEDLEIFPRQRLEGEGTGDSFILVMDSGVRLSYTSWYSQVYCPGYSTYVILQQAQRKGIFS